MQEIFKFILSISFIAMLVGCSEKASTELYNLTPDEWYAQIITDIKDSDLEAADKHYISMASEHVASPLLEQILLILAQAHANDEEYLLANYYLDEYIKRYGDGGAKTEFAQYLKIKANFDSFTQPNRNQKLMQDSVNEIEKFLYMYPNTQYRPLIDTMLIKFKLALYYLDLQIFDLYERTGRMVSAEIYQQKLDESPLKDANMIKPDLAWYRKLFE
ncbi:outer membrane protein assembly factor BamD [Campylobacter sp. faydin G-140]|uniref:outer membrane protein assembly factor BamD n=1 Tax=Campylobacter anatolicus TaxID=2829105 RepID=UPI001BA1411A|nr:outer membrane protein assembly factor BamD [Campylobacter anatolicus]MBR8461993.1 outer membrane protein assembly factor BamD [Campylobacter anatolicus]MBR8464918.1 outer membrane protein assembly factor BamD [Campylobacter anatolicus]